MKKLFLFTAVIVGLGLSTVSCEKGQLRDLENPTLEELTNGNNAEGDDPKKDPNPDRKSGIFTGSIDIPTHG